MTALDEFQKLEATGLYTPAGGGQRLDVWLSIGSATLIVTDRAERVLTHWSLAAIERRNPSGLPARFAPDAGSDEELEIMDETFVTALEKVRRAVEATRPKPGLLRGRMTAGAILLVLGAALVWLPDALTRTAARSMPQAARVALDGRLLQMVTRLTGPACDMDQGQAALDVLTDRLAPNGPRKARVLPDPFDGVTELPGGLTMIGASVVAAADSPAALSSAISAAHGAAAGDDPLFALLDRAGLSATLALLIQGEISDEALTAEARRLVSEQRETDLAASAPGTSLGDDLWVALRAICDR